MAARLLPPVAEPDTAAARGQPRRQLVLVHQLRVDVGHADDRPRTVELRPRAQDARLAIDDLRDVALPLPAAADRSAPGVAS